MMPRIALWGLAAVSATFALLWAVRLINVQPPFIDFLPLWTAGRLTLDHPAFVYDASVVSQAQIWLLGTVPTPRPFVYPPTALLWLAPLGRAPFWLAAWLWSGAGVAMFSFAAMRLAVRRPGAAVGIGLAAPTVVIALIAGQSDLISGGLALLALDALGARPKWAGLLLAAAMSLKPQVVVFAPVALIACGAVEAILSTAVASVVLIGASVALFGAPRWWEWLASLGPFQAIVAHTPGLAGFSLAPAQLARDLHSGEPWPSAVSLGLAVLGVSLVWFGFRRSSASLAMRCALLLGAGLMASPYALAYDGALLVAPAVAMALETEEGAGLAVLAPLVAVTAMALPWTGPLDLLAFMGLTAWIAFKTGDDPRV